MRQYLACGLLGLCAVVATPTSATAQEPTTTSPTVELLDPGTGPGQRLVFHPQAGTVTTSVTDVTTKVRQSGANSASTGPTTIRITNKATIVEVFPDGSFRVAFEYPSFKVVKSKNGKDALAKILNETFKTFTELSGEFTMAPNGSVITSDIEVPDTGNPVIGDLIQQVVDQADEQNPPLPSEPVGVGARWRTTTELELAGIHVRSTATYTLHEIDGTRLKLSVKITQQAPREDVEFPGVPPDVDVEVIEYRGTGAGTLVIDLSSAFPTEARTKTKNHQEFRIDDGSQSRKLVQDSSSDVTLKPAR